MVGKKTDAWYFLLLLIITVTLAHLPCPAAAANTVFALLASQTTTQTKFEPGGYYLPYNWAARGFENIEHLAIFPNARREDRMPPSGIYLKSGAVFKLLSPSIAREKISFTTATIKGVSYGFEGRFLSNSPADEDPEKPVLEGLLSKYVNGKEVAQGTVRWTYYSGD